MASTSRTFPTDRQRRESNNTQTRILKVCSASFGGFSGKMSAIVNSDEAASLVSRAAEAFGRKDYAKAENLYGQAITAHGFDLTTGDSSKCNKLEAATSFSNRAAARIRLRKYKDAIEDARTCVKLRPEWAKGYYRLAVALVELGEISKSYKAISVGHVLEPQVQLYRDMKASVRELLVETGIDLEPLEAEVEKLLPKQAAMLTKDSPLQPAPEKRMPVVVLSGFLGAGKTTLMQHVLSNRKGLRVALIVNDMSEVNVDAALLDAHSDIEVTKRSEEMVELSNGCICCTLRDDLLQEVARIATEGVDKYDYILVESTGISEPIPVAQTFLFEDAAGRSLNHVAKLDAMVTVVDAEAFLDNLGSLDLLQDRNWEASNSDKRTIAQLLIDQVEFANVVILNKVDRVDEDVLKRVKGVILSLNPNAKLILTSYAQVPLEEIMNTNLFDMDNAAQAPGWLRELRGQHTPETEEYGISSWVFRSDRPFDGQALANLVDNASSILFGECNIVRAKGLCWISQEPRMVLDWSCAGRIARVSARAFWKVSVCETKQNKPNENDRKTEVVFIGVGLNVGKLKHLLEDALSPAGQDPKHLTFAEAANKNHFGMIRDLLGALHQLGLDDLPILPSKAASAAVQIASEARSRVSRLAQVRARLEMLQDKPDELTDEELEEINVLATEFVELSQEMMQNVEDGQALHECHEHVKSTIKSTMHELHGHQH